MYVVYKLFLFPFFFINITTVSFLLMLGFFDHFSITHSVYVYISHVGEVLLILFVVRGAGETACVWYTQLGGPGSRLCGFKVLTLGSKGRGGGSLSCVCTCREHFINMSRIFPWGGGLFFL